MIVKIHLETSGTILEKKGRVRYKKGTKLFQSINLSHSKCSENFIFQTIMETKT